MKEHALSQAQYNVLRIVGAGMTYGSEIGRMILCSGCRASRGSLRKTWSRRRQRDEEDRRVVWVFATKAGVTWHLDNPCSPCINRILAIYRAINYPPWYKIGKIS